MNLQLIRYYKNLEQVKSQLYVNGELFCEAREGVGLTRREQPIEEGWHECTCMASMLSPMTLKVRRKAGKATIKIGWNLLRQWETGLICLGDADADEPPEERVLIRQQEVFEDFTQRVYEAYVRREPITLEVVERYPAQ